MKQSIIQTIRADDRREVDRVLGRRARRMDDAERAVAPIIRAVVKQGDAALVRFAKRWDGFAGTAAQLRVPESKLTAAAASVGKDFREAVKQAAANIREFCRLQMPREWMRAVRPGIRLGQMIRPLDSAGCYIPGGRYPLPSTLLMTAIPAQVAGVKRIVVCTPRPVPEILAVANMVGIEEVYTVGGAPAIAAMAYGTRRIPPVAKIVGPGNAYVAAAKRLVSRDVAIDFVAGPTEVLLIATEGNPSWIAADLLAQAEHDSDAAAVLITTSPRLAQEVIQALEEQLKLLPQASAAAASLRDNGAIIIAASLNDAVSLANRFAPEHLSVPAGLNLESIENAGGVFVGPYSPEAAGDYTSGPNHVLPTSGMARLRGGLSVMDFVKIISVQELTETGLRQLAPSIVTLARAEGLEAHARSIEVRVTDRKKQRESAVRNGSRIKKAAAAPALAASN